MNRDIIISNKMTLMEALSVMDKTNRRLLIICDGEIFVGVISIGDIQRALLDKQDLSNPVKNYGRNIITYASTDDDIGAVKELMRKNRIESMPVVDQSGRLSDIIEWDQLFEEEKKTTEKQLGLDVVIMAGGKGTRLLPLTNVIPKPLIPISDKTIIEEIMIRFQASGCKNYYISVNYKMEEIEKFFSGKNWNIRFIHEEKPLGTGGALFYVNEFVNNTFFVINCDTMIDVDLNDLITYHRNNKNIITVVSAVKSLHIPYGTLETETDGLIREIREKPDYVYQVNSGFYVFEPEALQYVQENEYLPITDLIERAIQGGQRVGAFPVPEGSWVDMGNWEDYLKVVNHYLENRV